MQKITLSAEMQARWDNAWEVALDPRRPIAVREAADRRLDAIRRFVWRKQRAAMAEAVRPVSTMTVEELLEAIRAA